MIYTTLAKITSLTLLTGFLAACGGRGGDGVPVGSSDFVDTDDPDKFLQFINPQNSLPAGTGYKLVVGTATAGESGDYTASITLSDGTSLNCSGSWTHSGGQNATAVGNDPCNFGGSTSFDVPESGGAEISVTSTVNTCIYVLDRLNNPVFDTATTGCQATNSLSLPKSRIDYDAHGKAYYNAIDPDNERQTLQEWIIANNFGQPCPAETIAKFGQCEVHVQFRDTKDLGYGRNMFARREDNSAGITHFAVYVENFQVDTVPGLQYSALNYQSLVENDRQWHFGSNAIEFSAFPYGTGDPCDVDDAGKTAPANNSCNLDLSTVPLGIDGEPDLYTKFYTFRADKTNFSTPEVRLDSVNLDSRGFRSMPSPCISCHGGKTRPLLPDGTLSPPYPGGLKGDTQAKMQAIEVDSIGFPNPGDPIPAGQEPGLTFINQAIHDTYVKIGNQNDADGDFSNATTNTNGKWNPTEAIEWLAGTYSGVDSNGIFNNSTYDSTFVPTDWQPNSLTGSPPIGADTLFLQVVKPHCLVCHSKRGNDNQNAGSISFKSYADFISHAEQIERYVYDKGFMPLGILNFDQFWDNISPNKASLMGTFIPGFSHANADGTAIEPGRAVAQISAPGVTRRAATTLSAAGSAFSDTYAWEITRSPAGSNPTLSSTTTQRVIFTPDLDGDYTLQLTTSNTTTGSGTPVTHTITVDDTVTLDGATLRPIPSAITFEDHIKPVLQGNTLGGIVCQNCHSAAGFNAATVADVPIHYTDAQVEGRDLYLEVIQRVNFSNPIESWLIRRPAGYQHPGGCLGGFDIHPGIESSPIPNCSGTADDRRHYDLFLTWILEGSIKDN